MEGEVFHCREAKNLTDRLERLVAVGALQNHKVFLITDNLAFEGAFYKGHSPSRELSDVVFQVHKAQPDGGFVLHVIHISEKRMKASGADGLSCGELTEGMNSGKDPLLFIPFNQGADNSVFAALNKQRGGKIELHLQQSIMKKTNRCARKENATSVSQTATSSAKWDCLEAFQRLNKAAGSSHPRR